MERTVVSGIPKAAEEAMENLKLYIVFRVPKEYHKEHVTIQDPWERNEVFLKDLADKSLATRIPDHEAYGPKIQQIFQRVKEAMMSLCVPLYSC